MKQPSQRPPRQAKEQSDFTYPIPHQAVKAFDAHLKSGRARNAGLIFDRFAPNTIDDNKGEAKKKGFEQTVDAEKKADGALLKALNTRWERNVELTNAEPFSLKTDWRFITGLGRKGPLEAGFTFNRYGFPILPGSSVKGLARAWAIYELGGEEKAEEDDDFKAIFGRATKSADEPGASGNAIFFDAIPAAIKLPELQLDIMNPHYPDYYSDNQFPTDWQNPKPVYFLTVAPSTVFRFAVGWRGTLNATLHEKAVKWLKEGLTNLGAGAKTSAGYGYFQTTESVAQPQAPAKTGPTQVQSSAASAQPARPSARHTTVGKVRYESGKPIVRGEEGQKWRVNWKELGMNALKEKTIVEIEYDEFEDGTYKVVRVTRKRG
jgi:CRISPR-associated protein Cmr6